jgi:chromosome segregation ATPase
MQQSASGPVIDDLIQECTKFEQEKLQFEQRRDVLTKSVTETTDRLSRQTSEEQAIRCRLRELDISVEAKRKAIGALMLKASSAAGTKIELEALVEATEVKEKDMKQSLQVLEISSERLSSSFKATCANNNQASKEVLFILGLGE